MKDDLINKLMLFEGGYVNDPRDSGGETNFGITVDVARKFGYMGGMKELPRATAFSIYDRMFWRSINGDVLCKVSPLLVDEVFDTAVNCGVGTAGKFLQRSLNVFNKRGILYEDIAVDGDIGGATVSALKLYAAKRDVAVLIKALNSLQGAYYINLAERREKDEEFMYGWMLNRVS